MTILTALLTALLVFAGPAASLPPLPVADRHRLVEALRLSDGLRGRLWPGWEATPVPILLVTDSAEYLLGHPRPTADFQSLGVDPVLGRELHVRAPVFPPTLLATFPAVGGMPTAVVGTAERTGKTSAGWVLAVLHEQFHQWQYTQPWYYPGVATLDLAGADTTGRWMLEFPFPYEAEAVQGAVARLARALAQGNGGTPASARRALSDVLTPPEERYLEFQLWQEGVARWIELAAARLAAGLGEPAPEFRALADYEPYPRVAARLERALREELDTLRLATSRRVAFYALGAAMAARLEAEGGDWRRDYAATPFRLDRLLEMPRR